MIRWLLNLKWNIFASWNSNYDQCFSFPVAKWKKEIKVEIKEKDYTHVDNF